MSTLSGLRAAAPGPALRRGATARVTGAVGTSVSRQAERCRGEEPVGAHPVVLDGGPRHAAVGVDRSGRGRWAPGTRPGTAP